MASKIPGGGGEVKLISKGMRELLKSPEVTANLRNRMKRVQGALPGSNLEVMNTSTRVRVKVERGSDFDEANTGELSRALDLAGGLRGDFTKAMRAKNKARRKSKGY